MTASLSAALAGSSSSSSSTSNYDPTLDSFDSRAPDLPEQQIQVVLQGPAAEAAAPATVEPADPATTTSAIAQSSRLGSANFNPSAMTPDALILYLRTRLGNVDGQMDEIFAREKAAEKVRGELRGIQELLTNLKDKTNGEEGIDMEDPEAFMDELNGHLEAIGDIDEELEASIREHLGSEGQILYLDDSKYNTNELNNSKDYLGMVSKDLESGSQMDMIALQSLMGARQTAIQLATNLVSALSESLKSTVSNIR